MLNCKFFFYAPIQNLKFNIQNNGRGSAISVLGGLMAYYKLRRPAVLARFESFFLRWKKKFQFVRPA